MVDRSLRALADHPLARVASDGAKRRWEYLIMDEETTILARMNSAGNDGWELIAIEPRIPGARGCRYILKRPL